MGRQQCSSLCFCCVATMRSCQRALLQSCVPCLGSRPQWAGLLGAASYIHIDAWEPFLETLNAFLDEHDTAVK